MLLLNVRQSDHMQPRGDAGEEAGGPERHPEERGGVSETAGRPADGKATEAKSFSLTVRLELEENAEYERVVS